MARILIDCTEDERQWNGEIDVRVVDGDSLSGTNMALVFGDHELIVTVNQAITLFDRLDDWMNNKPLNAFGAVRGRVKYAIEEMSKDRKGIFDQMFKTKFYSEEQFISEFMDYIKMSGLRFREVGEDPLIGARKRQIQSSPDI